MGASACFVLDFFRSGSVSTSSGNRFAGVEATLGLGIGSGSGSIKLFVDWVDVKGCRGFEVDGVGGGRA